MPALDKLLTAVLVGFLLLIDGAPAQPPSGAQGSPSPGRALDRLSRMPPEQRKRLLEHLPPERRRRLEERLERYNALPPDERRRLLEQLEHFLRLPSEQQDAARRLFRRYTALPEDRRKLLHQEFQALRTLPPAERRARIESPEVRKRYSSMESRILKEYIELLPQESGQHDGPASKAANSPDQLSDE